MTKTTHFNLFAPVFIMFTALIMLGVLPFTPAVVGTAILMSAIDLSVSWTKS